MGLAALLLMAIGLREAVAASDSCLLGCPTGASAANREIDRPIYRLSANPGTKFADWVAYRIDHATVGPTKPRTWRADPDLPAATTLAPADYRGANEALAVDRGHQAPLAHFTSTPYWEQTNYLSNITPQKSTLNQGPWERLEAAERRLVRDRGDGSSLHGVTGPLYEREMPRLPGTGKTHRIPSGYWKVLAVENRGRIDVAAFVMDQETPRDADFCHFATTPREIETRTGLTLFPEMEPNETSRVKSAVGGLMESLGCPAQ